MRSGKLAAIMAGLTLWALSLADTAGAQQYYDGRNTGIIDAGTNITVRTNQGINTGESDGRVFSASVAQDVRDRRGDLIIPKGSDVELIVRSMSGNELELDLDSVTINGELYGLRGEGSVIETENGSGANKRTNEYVGGGAVIGAVIGAIGGGAKGGAIGAGAGAGVQVLTRGRTVDVPTDSLLTFRLAEPLRAGGVDEGYTREGAHYHHGYGSDQYESQQASRQKPSAYSNGLGTISIRNDNNVQWQAAQSVFVYVQVDNEGPRFFGSGMSGVQPAPWMTRGHFYTFTLQDADGNVIARDQMDLRR